MNKYIYVRYCANPDWPNLICHKDKRFNKLTISRTKKFELNEYELAWKFIMECTSPITKLTNILWAFPRKEAFDILQSFDELKELPKEDISLFESLTDDIEGNEDVELNIEILNNKDKSFIDLI